MLKHSQLVKFYVCSNHHPREGKDRVGPHGKWCFFSLKDIEKNYNIDQKCWKLRNNITMKAQTINVKAQVVQIKVWSNHDFLGKDWSRGEDKISHEKLHIMKWIKTIRCFLFLCKFYHTKLWIYFEYDAVILDWLVLLKWIMWLLGLLICYRISFLQYMIIIHVHQPSSMMIQLRTVHKWIVKCNHSFDLSTHNLILKW